LQGVLDFIAFCQTRQEQNSMSADATIAETFFRSVKINTDQSPIAWARESQQKRLQAALV
jgi:hypothetical protein